MTNLGDDYTPAEARINRLFDRLTSKIGAIIMSAADDAVNAASDQLTKAKGEIDGVISQLESEQVSSAALDRLKGVSQSLDDVVPDAPAPATDAPGDAATNEPKPPATADAGDEGE